MRNIQYQSEEWQKKRLAILHRDNFTCQNCRTFNPQLGTVTVWDKEIGIELHEYEGFPNYEYIIHSQNRALTVYIGFNGDHLTLPVLQVHHKRYISNREIWDYNDDDLVTLCKECHELHHENYEISVFNEEGDLIELKKFTPNDFDKGKTEPWTFTHKIPKGDGQSFHFEKQLATDIHPHITYFVIDPSAETIQKAHKDAQDIVDNLFRRLLPKYKKAENDR